MPLAFEFDPRKSAANAEKNGIDFIQAQALWHDPDRLETRTRFVAEPRFRVLGQIGSIWAAFVIYRHDYQSIRFISVRRARQEEILHYADPQR